MTIANTTTQTLPQYPCNGVTTQFAFNNKIFAASDLVVSLVTNATGVVTPLTLNTHYTVSNVDVDTGCTVTTLSAYPSTNSIDIRSATPNTQSTSIKNQGDYFPELHEEAFDKVTRELQDLRRLTYTYGIHGPDVESTAWPTLPAASARRGFGLVFDASTGLPTLGTPASQTLTAGLIGQLLYPTLFFEVGVTNNAWIYGDVRRFGFDTSGVSDTVTAVNNAITSSASGEVFFPPCTAIAANRYVGANGVRLRGSGRGATKITFSNKDDHQIYCNGLTDFHVQDMQIIVTGAGSTSYVGCVAMLANSLRCSVTNVEFQGFSASGIYCEDVQKCDFHFNFFYSGNVTQNGGTGLQDSCDIMLRSINSGSQFCNVVGNQCFAGGWVGVSMLRGSGAPGGINYGNLVYGNNIGAHQAYGVLDYSQNTDNFNRIQSNHIEGILGSVLGNSSGAGVYVLNCGGDSVVGNTILNCCIQSNNLTLAPGGVGVSSCGAGRAGTNVLNNNISGMTKYSGVYATGCVAPLNIAGNTVNHPVSNVTGGAIWINGCSNVSVGINPIVSASTQSAILVQTAAANVSNIVIAGKQQIQCAGTAVQFFSSAGGLFLQCDINGINQTSVAAFAALNLQNMQSPTISDCNASVGNAAAISYSACTGVRQNNCNFASAGTYAVVTSGTCTNSFAGTQNYYAATGGITGMGAVNNAGTGFLFETIDGNIPTQGSHVIGDRVRQKGFAVGSPKGWSRVTTGAANVIAVDWINDGNL